MNPIKAYKRLTWQTQLMIGTVLNGLAFVYLMTQNAPISATLCLIVAGIAFYKFLKQGP